LAYVVATFVAQTTSHFAINSARRYWTKAQ